MPEPLSHIIWQRLPDINLPRQTRKPPFRQFPYRQNQSQHGVTLKRSFEGKLQGVKQKRESVGLDPSSLMILELTFLSESQRNLLERLGVSIVDERETDTPLQNIEYSVTVTFDNTQRKSSFSSANTNALSIQKILPVRASGGLADSTKLDLRFSNEALAKQFIANAPYPNLGIVKTYKNPQERSEQITHRLIVEFTDDHVINQFLDEWQAYIDKRDDRLILTATQRAELFDTLETLDSIKTQDKMSDAIANILNQKDNETEYYIDVDLWHPGDPLLRAEAIRQFRSAIQSLGGRVTDGPKSIADTLLIARVKGNTSTINWMISYDRTAWVDIPPKPELFKSTLQSQFAPPISLVQVPDDGPIACVIDSGVVSGHPLFDGVIIEEYDFDSGENSVSDLVGHGTHVAGVVVYGDVQKCFEANDWEPKVRILSGKIMKRNESGDAAFADETRIDIQIEEAIRYFHKEYDCKVFNLSIGHPGRPFRGGRQSAWALLLDNLSRELDVVIVVPTGNVIPEFPDEETRTTPQLEDRIKQTIISGANKIIDPASSALAITVGSLAHSDTSTTTEGRRDIVATCRNALSPFTRTGLLEVQGRGINKSIKPEVVAYGGNLKIDSNSDRWNDRDPNLGITSLNFDYQSSNRLLRSSPGTSFAAPYITHICARLEAHLRSTLSEGVSANLIRALVVHSASQKPETRDWITGGADDADSRTKILRLAGYGVPELEKAMYSANNRVTLIAQSDIEDNKFHLYELNLPAIFIQASGLRTLAVTLAYDPPVKGKRKEYLSRTMWFDVFKNLTPIDIQNARSSINVDGGMPLDISKNILDLSIPKSDLKWSTVQSAVKTSNNRKTFSSSGDLSTPAKLHILVGCQRRIETDEDDKQKYSLVVSLKHSNSDLDLHQTIKQQISVRQQVRIRV
jgi:Subtilase family